MVSELVGQLVCSFCVLINEMLGSVPLLRSECMGFHCNTFDCAHYIGHHIVNKKEGTKLLTNTAMRVLE